MAFSSQPLTRPSAHAVVQAVPPHGRVDGPHVVGVGETRRENRHQQDDGEDDRRPPSRRPVAQVGENRDQQPEQEGNHDRAVDVAVVCSGSDEQKQDVAIVTPSSVKKIGFRSLRSHSPGRPRHRCPAGASAVENARLPVRQDPAAGAHQTSHPASSGKGRRIKCPRLSLCVKSAARLVADSDENRKRQNDDQARVQRLTQQQCAGNRVRNPRRATGCPRKSQPATIGTLNKALRRTYTSQPTLIGEVQDLKNCATEAAYLRRPHVLILSSSRWKLAQLLASLRVSAQFTSVGVLLRMQLSGEHGDKTQRRQKGRDVRLTQSSTVTTPASARA